jgi:putative flippase GtrA
MMHPVADRPSAAAETGRGLRFLGVGGAAALIQLALVGALHEIARLPQAVAVSGGYVGSVVFHFMANRQFTFGQQGAVAWGEVGRYLVVAAVNYLLTLAVFAVLAPHLGIYPATVAAIVATTGFGYAALRHWVFAPDKERP